MRENIDREGVIGIEADGTTEPFDLSTLYTVKENFHCLEGENVILRHIFTSLYGNGVGVIKALSENSGILIKSEILAADGSSKPGPVGGEITVRYAANGQVIKETKTAGTGPEGETVRFPQPLSFDQHFAPKVPDAPCGEKSLPQIVDELKAKGDDLIVSTVRYQDFGHSRETYEPKGDGTYLFEWYNKGMVLGVNTASGFHFRCDFGGGIVTNMARAGTN